MNQISGCLVPKVELEKPIHDAKGFVPIDIPHAERHLRGQVRQLLKQVLTCDQAADPC